MNKKTSILIAFLAIALLIPSAFAQIRETPTVGRSNYAPGGDFMSRTSVFVFGTAVSDVTNTAIAAFPAGGTHSQNVGVNQYKAVTIHIYGATQVASVDSLLGVEQSSPYINNVTAALSKTLQIRGSAFIQGASMWNDQAAGGASNTGNWGNVILPITSLDGTNSWQVGDISAGVGALDVHQNVSPKTANSVTMAGLYRVDTSGMKWLSVLQNNDASADATTVVVITGIPE